jgi:hypothetical protein
MESEMTVAGNHADKQTDASTREGRNLLITWVIGTARGRTQMDSGTCFHPGWVISHTQYACTVNMAHIRTKDTATPEGQGLTQHRKDGGDGLSYIIGFSSVAARG